MLRSRCAFPEDIKHAWNCSGCPACLWNNVAGKAPAQPYAWPINAHSRRNWLTMSVKSFLWKHHMKNISWEILVITLPTTLFFSFSFKHTLFPSYCQKYHRSRQQFQGNLNHEWSIHPCLKLLLERISMILWKIVMLLIKTLEIILTICLSWVLFNIPRPRFLE